VGQGAFEQVVEGLGSPGYGVPRAGEAYRALHVRMAVAGRAYRGGARMARTEAARRCRPTAFSPCYSLKRARKRARYLRLIEGGRLG